MRDKIVRTPVTTHQYQGKRYLTLDGIDQILTLVKEEIKKVQNPYSPKTAQYIAFERGRIEILLMLGTK